MAFNVLDFVTGASYPKEVAHLYIKGEEASKISELQGKVSRINDQIDAARELGKSTRGLTAQKNKLQDEVDALRESIKGGIVTFHLQGFPEHIRTTIAKKLQDDSKLEGWDSDRENLEYLYALTSATTRKVYGPDGEEDTTEMTPERVRDIFKEIPQGGLDELVSAVYRLAHESVKFEDETTDSF